MWEDLDEEGVVQAGYMHPKDWGGGYYPAGLLQADLVTRLLMYGYSEDDALDIPYGEVWGVYKTMEKGMVEVGVKNMKTRSPAHLTAP